MDNMSNIVIVGGSDAGINAALRMRELNAGVDITVIVADAYPGFSICGLPFFLSGEIADWQTLAHHNTSEFE
jgi:NADPH-dependent 2,4-dienoyl-CoA reductase/sulfur reductase-like enzyme